MEDSTVQTVEAPGAREINAGQYPQGDIGPNQEYRLAPQADQLDAGTRPTSNTGYRVDPMDLDVGYIQAPVLPPGGIGDENPERASGEGILSLGLGLSA